MNDTLPRDHATRRLRPPVPPTAYRPWCLALAAALSGPAGIAAQGAVEPAADAVAVESRALRSGTKVTVNFVDADIDAVTRAYAAMIERQILVDPRVKGKITVFSEQPQTIRQSWRAYLAALRGLGFAMVENGGLLKLVPEADAKLQAGVVSVGGTVARSDQILTQIFTLRYENPASLVSVLRPLISANNTINASPGSNALVITDYADNLQRLAKIIAALDQPGTTDIEIIPLQHAVAADLAPLVQRLAADGSPGTTVRGAPAAPAGATASTVDGVTVAADSRHNALVIKAPNRARLAMVLSVIDKLDRPSRQGGPAGSLWVVHLRNADAVKLATVLRAAFADGGGGAGAIAAARPVAPGTATARPAGTPTANSEGPSTGGLIQADPSTNSLIITAPEPLYRQMRSLIDQLDARRAQVYIESMIVEVSGDNAADFGFQWQGLLGTRGDSNLVGLGTNFGSGGSSGNIIGLQTGAAAGQVNLGEGFNIGLIRNFGGVYALAGIARALQSQTRTNIISTPNLITLDNEEAKIVVGSNVPFVTGQFTSTGTATTNPFQTIERKDVGITLRIRPQIGEGGTVRMAIFQESSSVSDKVAPGTTNAGPSTNKRQIETNVVVDDGGIIVLGGLIEDRFVDNESKVPLLGDVPGLGALFRSENRSKTRTNLMVFLRPVVLRDAEVGQRLTLDRYDLIRATQEGAQPAPSRVMPINESPVVPPLPAPGAARPSAVPPLNPPAAPGG